MGSILVRAQRQRQRTHRKEPSAVSYALLRGREWITAPEGDGDPIPPVLAIDSDQSNAWLSPTLDLAIERQSLLRMCWGWSTEIRVIKS